MLAQLAKTTSTSKIESLMSQLLERKAQLLSVEEKLEVALKEQWGPYALEKRSSFSRKLSAMQKVVRLELAIIASIKDFVDPEIVSDVRAILAKVRKDNNLSHLLAVYHKNKDDVKTRQVLKLVSAVYRINRDLIYGMKTPNLTQKSTIKYATLCPHCGETSRKILQNLTDSRSVILP